VRLRAVAGTVYGLTRKCPSLACGKILRIVFRGPAALRSSSEERPVEKLERVLMAEEEARSALADALTEAAAIRAAGVDDAKGVEAEAAEASKRAVAAGREAALTKARADADIIASEAAAAAVKTLEAARGRLDDTVRRIAASLEG
jgi:flagellar biosynthesis/type III secretory pathway protein FliH